MVARPGGGGEKCPDRGCGTETMRSPYGGVPTFATRCSVVPIRQIHRDVPLSSLDGDRSSAGRPTCSQDHLADRSSDKTRTRDLRGRHGPSPSLYGV